MRSQETAVTYKAAGVDLAAGDAIKRRIASLAAATHGPDRKSVV